MANDRHYRHQLLFLLHQIVLNPPLKLPRLGPALFGAACRRLHEFNARLVDPMARWRDRPPNSSPISNDASNVHYKAKSIRDHHPRLNVLA